MSEKSHKTEISNDLTTHPMSTSSVPPVGREGIMCRKYCTWSWCRSTVGFITLPATLASHTGKVGSSSGCFEFSPPLTHLGRPTFLYPCHPHGRPKVRAMSGRKHRPLCRTFAFFDRTLSDFVHQDRSSRSCKLCQNCFYRAVPDEQ